MSNAALDIYNSLNTLLDDECLLYRRYLKLIEEERLAVTKSDAEKVADLSAQRESILEQMLASHKKRLEILRTVTRDRSYRLSDFVQAQLPAGLSKPLLKKIEILRSLAASSRQSSRELSQIVAFAQKIVSGLASILHSATQSVFRSYTPGGKMKESYHSTELKDSRLTREI